MNCDKLQLKNEIELINKNLKAVPETEDIDLDYQIVNSYFLGTRSEGEMIPKIICNTLKDDEGNYAKDKWCELCRPFVI